MSWTSFHQVLNATYEMYGKQLDDLSTELFLTDLRASGVSSEQAIDALGQYRRAGNAFAPRVGQIIEIINGNPDDAAELAWGKANRAIGAAGMYTPVVFDDPKLMNAIEIFGGWPAFCQRQVDNEVADRAAFRKAYHAAPADKCTAVLGGAFGADSDDRPVMIGDAAKCQRILESGKRGPMLGSTRGDQTLGELLKQATNQLKG